MEAPDAGITIRRASASEVIDLRHAVLRQGLPREEAMFRGDEAPSSRHYGAFRGDMILCCATLHLNEWQGEPAWQLRGMATSPDARRQGLGHRVLALIEQDLRFAAESTSDPGAAAVCPLMLWCNARVPALEFYRGLGWQVVSDQFDIPTAGPHVRMVKRLSS